jgi:hypothetical protein
MSSTIACGSVTDNAVESAKAFPFTRRSGNYS